MRMWVKPLVTVGIIGLLFTVALLFGQDFLYAYHSGRAEANLSNNQPEAAIDHLVWMFEQRPEDAALCLKLTDAYLAVGNDSRAEYILAHGMKAKAGQVELYKKLSAVYVAQDKIWDAVNFLDELPNPLVKEQLDALRPPKPVFTPAPGRYEQNVTCAIQVPEGAECYLSLHGDVPSTADGAYEKPIPLPAGVTDIRAVAVKDGLVSTWALGSYRLENILQPVEFTDPLWEEYIRALVNKPVDPVMSNELWDIQEIVRKEPAGYTSLGDLEHLSGLTTLYLVGTGQHVDISPLAALTKLKKLTLRGFALDATDLDILAQWEWVENLDLQDNRIASLTPLADMKSLKTLNLRTNSIADITPLGGLTRLTSLDLSQNALEDSTPLAELVGLKSFLASENRLTELRGLRPLTELQTVNISRNEVEDLSPLANHKNLVTLLCTNNPIASLSPLEQCTKLEVLSCTGGAIETTEPLAGCVTLRELSLNDNALKTLEGLNNCLSLTTVNVDSNKLTSIDPLSVLQLLKTLRMEHNNVKSVAPLKSCPSLRNVYAFDNPLTDKSDVFKGTAVTLYRGNAR